MSRGGYYGWRRRSQKPSQRRVERERFDLLVKEAFGLRKGRSGATGLTLDIKEQGQTFNRKTVAKSMSGKGNCYDNAVAESFFHTLKVEMVHDEHFATRQDMRRAVFEYIEVL